MYESTAVTVPTATKTIPKMRYINSEKQINEGYYKHSSLLITVLTAFIFLVSVLLIIYLVNSI